MSLLKIVHYPEPVLLTVGKPIGKEEFNADLEKLVEDMFETMYDAQGVGLAAPQVGLSKRLFVMDVPTDEGKPNRIALINPQIVTQEGEQVGDEGCLSFPGIYTKVRREVRTARCVLHETDHCDGIVFLDRMTTLKREFAKRRIKKLQKTGKWD
jgi:peptide deformylase